MGARSGAKKQAASKLTEQNERLQEFKSAKENNDALGRKKESRTRGWWRAKWTAAAPAEEAGTAEEEP